MTTTEDVYAHSYQHFYGVCIFSCDADFPCATKWDLGGSSPTKAAASLTCKKTSSVVEMQPTGSAGSTGCRPCNIRRQGDALQL